jgi:hypothetical protein
MKSDMHDTARRDDVPVVRPRSNKSLLFPAAAAALLGLLLLPLPGRAAEKAVCEVAVAALSLPAGSDGLVHWRAAADSATTPLQLSTRYFSGHLKLQGNVIAFYAAPVAAGQTEPAPPEPLLSLTIPAASKLTYVVLYPEQDANQQVRWRGRLLPASEWQAGSMKVFNASSEPLGISAGRKQLQLAHGKTMDFLATEWKDAFPVKIFRLQPETKLVFSSSWRVAAGRRELCFIANINGRISLKSLLDLAAKPST